MINDSISTIAIINKIKTEQTAELNEKIKGYHMKSQDFKQIMKFMHVGNIFNVLSILQTK